MASSQRTAEAQLAGLDIACYRAPNPGRLTLDGTNSWIVGRDPAYLIDPGPAVDRHTARLAAAVAERGGLGAILLTHDHHDHSESASALGEQLGAPIAATRGDVDVVLGDGSQIGPLTAYATPGHAPDHLAYVVGEVCFTGDAVLGAGSVFVDNAPGALAAYLDALARLRRLDVRLGAPGHGAPIADLQSKLTEYIEHRLERERRLVAALEAGLSTREELLDRVWADVPAALRDVALVVLDAHLGKLRDEGRLPTRLANL